MISIYQKIQKVETLHRQIDQEISRFKSRFAIDCIEHCSECCSYDQIQATPLEFLPFAYHTQRLGLIEQWYDELEKHGGPLCFFRRLENHSWGCRIYPVRGVICRLFGFSATTDKLGHPIFAACRVLKSRVPDQVTRIREQIAHGGRIPVLSSYYRRLASIDQFLGNEFMPINLALKKSIEIVYFKMSYRDLSFLPRPASVPVPDRA